MRKNTLVSVNDYSAANNIRRDWLAIALIIVLIVSFGIYVGIGIFVPQKADLAPFLAIAVFITFAIPIAIWNRPQVGIYIIITCAALFVQSPKEGEADPLTMIPIFWNISTIGYNYLNTQALSVVQFNMGELIILFTAFSWGIHEISLRRLSIKTGVFFPWLTAYIACTLIGAANGIANGGDLTFVLWELRAQFYFYLAYLMACNMFRDRKELYALLWAMTIGIGLKSLIGTRNYIMNPSVTADEGVLRHEDSLLMNLVILAGALFSIGQMEPRLKRAMLLFTVPAAVTVLANGRRASIAALFLALPLCMLMIGALIQERRQQMIKVMGTLLVLGALYLPIAWNGKGVWALPARAIRSQFAPDERDASSDYYRLAENTNLKYTRDLNPFTGFGYGREYITIYEQYGRTDVFARILPHNGILWIWMRLGHIGFFCFWMFFASVLVWGPQSLRNIKDPTLKILGIYGIGTFLMLVMYGKYDLAFANYRAMILVGTMLGVTASIPFIDAKQEADKEAERERTIFRAPVATPEEVSRHQEEVEAWRTRTQW
jgi:hypothetical protein